MSWTSKHLLGLEGVTRDEIVTILDTAAKFREILDRPVKKVPTLRGRLVANLFYENSTRTRFSFEIAERRLTADSISFAAATSSAAKGETLLDTCRNLEAMAPDAIVIRHQASGAPHFLARNLKCAVINAGDGTHAHPTQALLDAFTMRRAKGKLEGLRVAICGDVRFSRVARSNLALLPKMGAEVTISGPPTMIPSRAESMGVKVICSPREAVKEKDVIIVLRIQLERQGRSLFPSLREYAGYFGINGNVLTNAPEDAIIMHPGPINRGVELSSDVADGPRSVILDQVTNGVAVRMALLYLVMGNS